MGGGGGGSLREGQFEAGRRYAFNVTDWPKWQEELGEAGMRIGRLGEAGNTMKRSGDPKLRKKEFVGRMSWVQMVKKNKS